MLNFGKKEVLKLGNRRVEVPKLTRNRLKKLTEHVGTIGDFLVKFFLTPQEDRSVFIVAGADVTIDEIYEITSLLSDIDIEELSEQASIAECTEYLLLTWQKNDMNAALGNLKGLIPPMAQQFVQSIVQRMNQAAGQ
ncbi:hypothetical protein SAMN04487895_104219 [Paenibacillus sophorae]|uniref:Uncharacterized protein n=1 Tax=Paenibacillus sophorae TaxID=1333845 RepID=A0A1H8L7U4_9BACL|nr:hypothetical protein [Paenibacillus sophorae]QWU17395.1 hypothetical protein KP014_09700 [Paenibacillus sophorae]SEO01187.1 hypothetical protein SAMN04487895_104219 [Paenibacillus sophorae]